MLLTVGKMYSYSTLKDTTGSVKIIAVVKFYKEPKRTITDRSLDGDKMTCVSFNDTRENLPPVRESGDVIAMQHLVINEFRDHVQSCGYASIGFTEAVFSKKINDTLTLRQCPVACSPKEPKFNRVKELRNCATSEHQIELISITANGYIEKKVSYLNSSLWSVPVGVYNEHSSKSIMSDSKLGELVQINNVHIFTM
ncbi:unnamed protein product [Echinostoma caproni]|uniref:Telo_bind domain-containing protein n=1 Tax=Echinostoma caproni TaxID=27848 RepID=A0A183BEW4_9TREM|nr:unnamed protein product [Echinostoma caproni]